MSDILPTNPPRKHPALRVLLLLLAILLSPLSCCGCYYSLDALSSALLPAGQHFTLNIFEAEALVVNRSSETYYITPLTTTTGRPLVIPQPSFIRQRDIPLRPGQTILLTYDAADMVLAGIAVCRSQDDCRFLAADHAEVYYLDAIGYLPRLEPEALQAMRSHPAYNFGVVLFPLGGLLSWALFLFWLKLLWQDKKRAG